MATLNRLHEAPSPERILRARGITRSFARGLARSRSRACAVDKVDLDLWSGDVVGVIGREGAGKTALLQCLAGLLRRDAGTLEWFGELFPGGGCLPGLAYVPAMPVYYPFLTVRDVLEYCNARETVGRAQRQAVDSAMERLELTSRSAKKIVELTREEMKRLAIAEALSFDPRVVLVDTSYVDIVAPCSNVGLHALRAHAESGAAVMIAARDAHSVVSVASRVLILEEGKLVRSFYADAPLEQVSLGLPRSPGATRFVAERVH